MPFDPSTARPITQGPQAAQPSGFDPSTAQPFVQDPSAAANFISSLLRVPGAIAGMPAAVVHAKHWLDAKVNNAAANAAGRPEAANQTASQLDKANPVTRQLPTAEGIDKRVFDATGVTPYVPQTILGKLSSAGVTGVGAGLLDPMALAGAAKQAPGIGSTLLRLFKENAGTAGKVGAASAAAAGAQAAFPNSDLAPLATALVTHGGAGLAARGASAGVNAARQVFAPSAQGVREAGQVLARTPDAATGEAVAQPAASALNAAQRDVQNATNAIGPGLDDYTAGTFLRQDAQGRKNSLLADRKQVADNAYDAFRQEPPLDVNKLEPFLQSPSFRQAMREAGRDTLDIRQEAPLTDYWTIKDVPGGNLDDAPAIQMRGAAIPPSVLDRVKQKLDDHVTAAKTDGDRRTATILRNDFRDFIDQQYPNTYAQARGEFGAASEPLAPFAAKGPLQDTLKGRKGYDGTIQYDLPADRVTNTFLQSRALRTDYENLLKGFGADAGPTTALKYLRENLIGKVQDAIGADGTLSSAAFDRAVKPYTKALNMWFPGLAKQFGNAKAAQSTVDTLHAQRGLADAIDNGALRDRDGAVTAGSLDAFLRANKAVLEKTQTPTAVMRLRSIQAALGSGNPGEVAEVLKSSVFPAAAGLATGGVEGGVFGALMHRTLHNSFGGLDARRQAAFSQAIERAVLDPAYAAKLTAGIAKRPRSATPLQALARTIATTAVETNAAGAMEE